MRKLVIGDIHGALLALLQILERSNYNKDYDQLIFLGDYIDGWSESAEVIEFLIDLKNQAINKPIFLLGNHDVWLKEFLFSGIVNSDWKFNGGLATLQSYSNMWEDLKASINDNSQEVLDNHRKFFNELIDYYIDDKNRAFVHAGCDLIKGVQATLPYSRIWDRKMWEKVLSGAKVKAHKELYIGHTTTMSTQCKPHSPEALFQPVGNYTYVPINRQNVWNIDTGAGWSGKLSIMDIDTKQFWQSDFVKDLYPNEKGR